MRRRISLLLATVLAAASFAVLGPSQPATAWTLCTGTGVAAIGADPGPSGTGMLYPVGITSPSKTPGLAFDVLLGEGNPVYNFVFVFAPLLTVPNCVHTNGTFPTIVAAGVVKGYCGLSSGFGVTSGGDLFAFVDVGGKVVFTGHLVGIVSGYTADPTIAGNTCTHGTSPGAPLPNGALTFILGWSIFVVTNCDTTTLQTLVPETPPDHQSLIPLVTTQVLASVFHVLVNLGVHYFWNHLCFGSPVLS